MLPSLFKKIVKILFSKSLYKKSIKTLLFKSLFLKKSIKTLLFTSLFKTVYQNLLLKSLLNTIYQNPLFTTWHIMCHADSVAKIRTYQTCSHHILKSLSKPLCSNPYFSLFKTIYQNPVFKFLFNTIY